MAGTQGQVEAVWEGSCTKGEQRRHIVCLKKRHQSCREVTQNTDSTEAFCERKLMRHSSMPSCILPIKELHTPGFVPSAQPAILSGALAGNGGICDAQLPVSLPSHINLPVMASKAVALRADDVEGGVKASREVRKLLPGVCVGGTVTFRGDDQLWVGRVWIQMNLTGIWRHMFNTFYTKDFYNKEAKLWKK